MVRALEKFYINKKASETSENFCNYFSSIQSIEQTFFLSFHEQTIFLLQVAKQTIYFPLFAEQSFFSLKTIAPRPLPPRNQMVGPLASLRCCAWDRLTGTFSLKCWLQGPIPSILLFLFTSLLKSL